MVDEFSEAIIQAVNKKDLRTFRQIVAIVKQEFPLETEEKIRETVLMLQKMGKIQLEDRLLQKPTSFVAYMNNSKVLWYWITIVVAFIVAIGIFLIPSDLESLSFLRTILGALFVLWLPGYSCVKALFPLGVSPQSSPQFEVIERIALSIAMSIAIDIIVGLFIYHTPWGISLDPIVLCLTVLTVVFATFAVIRDYYLEEKSQKTLFSRLFSR
jgi:uncharacterized membrane protein